MAGSPLIHPQTNGHALTESLAFKEFWASHMPYERIIAEPLIEPKVEFWSVDRLTFRPG